MGCGFSSPSPHQDAGGRGRIPNPQMTSTYANNSSYARTPTVTSGTDAESEFGPEYKTKSPTQLQPQTQPRPQPQAQARPEAHHPHPDAYHLQPVPDFDEYCRTDSISSSPVLTINATQTLRERNHHRHHAVGSVDHRVPDFSNRPFGTTTVAWSTATGTGTGTGPHKKITSAKARSVDIFDHSHAARQRAHSTDHAHQAPISPSQRHQFHGHSPSTASQPRMLAPTDSQPQPQPQPQPRPPPQSQPQTPARSCHSPTPSMPEVSAFQQRMSKRNEWTQKLVVGDDEETRRQVGTLS